MRERIAQAIMVSRNGRCLVNDWASEARDNPNVSRAISDADAALEALMEPTEGMILSQGKCRPDLAKTDRHREATTKVNEAVRRMAKETFVEMILAAKGGL